MIRRRPIDAEIEKKIITGLIVSDEIAAELIPITSAKLLQLEPMQKVFKWIKEFHAQYGHAPGSHIQDLYNMNRESLSVPDMDLLSEMLHKLSKDYEGESLNKDYVLEQSKKYLKKRHVITLADEMKALAESDEIDLVDSKIQSYGSVIDSPLSKWTEPFDDMQFVNRVFNSDTSESVLSFGGAIDKLLGPVKPTWVICLIGPSGHGKSFSLSDFAIAGVMSKINVVYFNHEMEDIDLAGRLYQSLGNSCRMGEGGIYLFPTFDCLKNQDDTCTLSERTNIYEKPEAYDKESKYKPCTFCRKAAPKDFKAGVWFYEDSVSPVERKKTVENLKQMQLHFGSHRFKLITYNMYEANVKRMDSDLKAMEYHLGWTPHLIVSDYQQIQAPEEQGLIGRDKENATSVANKALARKWKAVLATAHQGNRDSYDVDSLGEKHISEEIRVLNNYDIIGTINQTEDEKAQMVSRFGLLKHRFKGFKKSVQAMVLQNFHIGRYHLDSVLTVRKPPEKKRKGKK